ncbi:MAG: hypothetical protein GYA46_07705 [candidate division Zixibacteria bacterium]|nr:hypothetical protein [candidate division Zixibacteria bacterium]
MKSRDTAFFSLVLVAYLIGQALIGTYLPADGSFHFDTPADIDFLYYAGIFPQMIHSFPPQNPAYGGVALSQSFIQYYPTALVSLAVNPYLAMRLMNLVFLLILVFVLKRYFTSGWGIGLAVIAAGSVGFGLINSLGIDLVARGFNHFPFFIALTVALFEKDRRLARWTALFLLGWLHAYLALVSLVCLGGTAAVQWFRREPMIDTFWCLLGVAAASLITLGTADKPFYFVFVEGFRFDLSDLWMHALPAVALVAPTRDIRLYIWTVVAFLFGLFFHYNPFFPVFLLYFIAGIGAAKLAARRGKEATVATIFTAALFVGFVVNAVDKYDPRNGAYLPHLDRDYDRAARWLQVNTPPEAVLLTAPLEPDWRCRLQEGRALYLGFIPHVAHLGIDWRGRAQKLANYFAHPAVCTVESDYVVYGPTERRLFPGFALQEVPVYRDDRVTIWKVNR